MIDEMELFEEQLKLDVMTLGWIHTHPQFVSDSFYFLKLIESVLELSRFAQPTWLLTLAA